MRSRNRARPFPSLVLIFVALSLSVTAPAFAQYSSGVEGTVTDQTGALLPSAQVSVTNLATGVKETATANSQGFFQVLHLPPGRYNVAISAAGFSPWVQADVDIEGTDIRTI